MFKKILKIAIPIVVASALGSLSFLFIKNSEYHIDTTFFQSTYAYKDDVNLEGLTIVETEKDEVVNEIPVDESMVVSCDSTSSVGEKTLVLEYEKEQFIVNFVVMYEIQFIVDEKVADLQYVYKASEIKLPKDPTKTGYEFRGWSPAVPNVINDNMVFTATFGDVPVEIPNLGSYGTFVGSGSNGSFSRPIQYGDTLAGIELPSNEYGSWKFVDPLDTVVGNVGENKFMVEFIPTNPELTVLKDYVTVIVAKKTLEFKNIVSVFEYDGEVHVPTYELDVEGLTVVSIGEKGVEVGDYSITYIINDANYDGMVTIDYKIVSSEISISFDLTGNETEEDPNTALYVINLGEATPEIKYTVSGIDDPSILNIKLNVPSIKHAGEYLYGDDITLTIGNTSYNNVKVTNGCKIIVNKASLGVGKPAMTSVAIYGNKLSSVTFEDDNPNGYWAWENPDLVFEAAGEIVVNMIFTPYSALDYEMESAEITLDVQKRELKFVIDASTYTYEVDKDGNPVERTVLYTLYDGENEITDINVVGNIVRTDVCNETVNLVIEEDNYQGKIDTSLRINKATPKDENGNDIAFDFVTDAYVNTTLKDIALPEGFSWVNNTIVLTTENENPTVKDVQTYDVIYTPADVDNYEILTGKFTVNVSKYQPSIVTGEYDFTYDGTTKTLTGIYATCDVIELNYTTKIELKYFIEVLIDGEKTFEAREEILNAGNYKVEITLPSSPLYYQATKTIEFTVKGSQVTNPTEFKSVFGNKVGSIDLTEFNKAYEGKGYWEWVEPGKLVGEAGKNSHDIYFVSTNTDYASYTHTVSVVVEQKVVTIEVTNNTYNYEKNVERTILYKVLDGEIDLTNTVAVTGNLFSVNACNLSTILIIDDKNYQGSVETSLIVNKIDPEVEWPTVTVPLNQELIEIKLEEGFVFTCSNETLSTAGEFAFDAEYTPVDTVNYNKLTGKITVIVKASASAITGVEDSYRFEYGEEIVINAKASHDESELQYVYTLNGEVVAEPKNVGTYELTITLPATNNYVVAEKKVTVEIYEKELEVKWLYEESYEYTGNEFEIPTAYVQDINGDYQVLVVTEVNAKDFVNAGVYAFVATFASDYADASNYKLTNATSKEIAVEKAIIDLSTVKWDYAGAFIYDENEHSVELLSLHSALSVEYTENVKTDAGSYTATATVSFINPDDANNYSLEGEIDDCEWIITSSAVVVAWECETEYTFTGKEIALPKATILNGTIELTVTEVDGKVFRNADTYSFVASYEGSNYELSNTTLSNVVVEKAELEVEWAALRNQTYTGETLVYPIATVLNGDVQLRVKPVNTSGEEVEFINAGIYSFVASFDAEYEEIDNYILDESTTTSDEVEVYKGTYGLLGMEWNYSSLTYNGKSQKVELSYVNPALTPIYSNNEFTNVGKYEATVTFEYDEENFHEPVIDSLSWEIAPYEATVTWDYEEVYKYTGSVLAAPTATYVNINGETLSLAVVEENGKSFLEYGDYTFVASIADEEVANNYKLISDSLAVSIGKSKVTIGKLSATYGDTLADVILPDSDFGAWVFVDDETTSVGNAGDNTFDIRFESTSDNYSTYTTTVTITVAKKLVVIDVIEDTYEYNGSAKTIDAKVKDGETVLDVTVYGNTPATNAGTYNVTLYINDSNYEAEVVSTVLEITKAKSVITNNLTETSRDYNGSETDIKPYFTLNHKEAELAFAITAARAITTIKDAGTYTIVVSVPETDNYLAKDITVTYTVNKISPELSYNAPDAGYTYNGSAISIADYITHVNTDQNIAITYAYQYEGETVDAIKEAGTYNVTVSIAETINFKAQYITFEVVVEKGHLDVGQMSTIDAIYGQQLNHFEFAADTRGTWSWKNPNDYVGNVGENKHIAILTPFDDSIGAEEVEITFNVTAKAIIITLGQTTFDYDGTEHEVTWTLSETPEGVTVDVEGTIAATNYKDGGYAFTLTITGNNNYCGTTSGTLVINQISSGVTAPSLNAIYKQTYNDVVLPTSEDGVWSLVVENLSAEVGNAITKSVTVKYTPNNTNYKIETMSATLVVAKADYKPTTIPTTYDAKYGDMLAKLLLPTDDDNGSWRWETAGSTVGNAGVNQFTAIFTHDDQNYNVYTTSVTVNVDKAQSEIIETLPTSFTYSGEELIKQYFKLNHSESSLAFTITGKDSTVLKAGTYNVVVTVAESNNYYGTKLEVGTIVVEQATPKTDFSTNFTYTYGKVLSSADLPDGYEWINEVKLEVGANQAIAAKYVPTDTENYKTVYDTFNVTIERIVGTISVNDNQEFTYGDAIDLGATTNNVDTDAKIVITGLTLNSDGFVDAGTYIVTLSVAKTAHYTAVTETITVTVNKKEVEIETEESYEYGTEASDVQLTSVYGTFETYSENPNANVQTLSLNYNSSNENSLFVESKSIWVKFVPYVEYAHNFAEYVKEVVITIVKKELTFTDVTSSFVYDGNAHSVVYSLTGFAGSDTIADVTVSGNTSITNVVDSTSVTLTVESQYYYGTWTGELNITKATPKTDFTTVYDVYWNTKLSDIELPANYSFDVDQTLTTVDDGQTFAATYNLNDSNYITVSGKFTVNVKRIVTTINVNDLSGLTYKPNTTYTITATATNAGEAKPVVTVNGSETYSIGNAGTYNVVVTVAESAHYTAATLEYDVVIAKANPTTDFTTVYSAVWNTKLSGITLPTGYAWVDADTVLSSVGNGQTFAATFTPSDTVNYNIITKTFTVNVEKATAKVTANATYTFTYSGSAFTLTNVNPSHTESTVEYTYKIGDTVYESLLNAGTYTVTITLPESAHYKEATTTATVTINKAKVALPTGLKATYGQTLANVVLPTSSYGTWSFVLDSTTSVGDSGNNTFQIKFTSTNANYTDFVDNVTVTVAKVTTTITANIPTGLVYNESTFDHASWFTANHSETTMAIALVLNGSTVTSVTNAGTYTITVSMVETTNYTAYSNTYTVTVAQADYTVDTIPTSAAATYGDTLGNIALSGGDTNGTWTWVSGTDLVGNAGTRTHNAIFTPTNTNYKPSTHAISVTVNRKQVTINVTSSSFVYDGNAHSVIYTLEGVLSGDTVNVSGNKSITNVLESISSLTLTISGNDNYEGSWTGALTITKANPTFTLPTYTDKYEDRVVDENLVSSVTAKHPTTNVNVPGTFSYDKSTVIYNSEKPTVSVLVTFTPSDTKNYNIQSGNMSVTLLPVAENEDGKLFGTIEKAIDGTDSGVITIKVGSNPIIKNNTTIRSNITLLMPYAEGVANSSTATSQNFELTGTITNTLTISDGVILTVNGTLEIGGILSGGNGGSNYAGQTCDQYTIVYLGQASQIYSTGSILCYGYILEKTYYNDSSVIIDSGTISMPFILRDFKGGSQTYGLYSAFDTHHSSPFNQYEFLNVTPLLRINFNGSLNAWANLYAGSQHNPTTIQMVGTSDESIIQFTDSTYSYFEAKYDERVVNGYNIGKTNITIYGGANANKLTLTLKVLSTMTITTQDVFFPITYKYKITLQKSPNQVETAEFIMNQRYKLMPGAVLKVSEGTKLTAGELIVYSYFDDSASIMAGNKYPVKEEAAKLIVNGSLEVADFGGVVTTETNSGAIVNITGTTSLTSYEPKEYSGSSISTKITDWYPIAEQFKLHLFEGSSISINAKTVAQGTYYSKNKGWYSTSATIFYDANGGTLTGESSEGAYETGATGYLISSINTTDPVKAHYNFEGWYMDEALTIPAVGNYIYVNSYIYAKWSPVNYNINYYNSYFEGSTDVDTTNYGTFNYETELALINPTNGNYVFGGWYTDGEYKNRITNIIGTDMVELLSDNTLILYALWYPSGTETYKVTYESNLYVENEYDYRNLLSVYDEYSFVIIDDNWSSVKIQQMNSIDTNPSYSYYFGGWYTTSDFSENTKVTSISSGLFEVNNNITLYARWIKKYEIIVEMDSVSLSYYLQPSQTITLPTPQKLGISFAEVEDKTTYIILRKLQFVSDGIVYSPNDQFTATKDTTLVGSIVETNYYQTTLQAEKGTVNISLTNGYLIKSSEDIELKTSYSYTNTGALASENIYISANSTVTATFTYNVSEYNGYAISYVKDGNSISVQADTYKSGSGWFASYKGTPANPNSFVTGPYIYTIGMSSGNSSNEGMCIYGDAKILMSDGTTKLAKDVKLGDVVLTWSFAEGKYVATPIMFVEKLQGMMSHKTTLFFDDGTSVELANGQSYFDVNKREFVSINNNNVFDYIGITIMSYDNGKVGYKQIVNASVEIVMEDTYEFITAYEYSFIYDNVLTMEPFMLYKLPFIINEDFMYDQELMLKDIETYGLYTYEEWSSFVTEEQFELFNGWYIKVAVEKGYYTIDYLIEIIQKYVNPQNMGK